MKETVVREEVPPLPDWWEQMLHKRVWFSFLFGFFFCTRLKVSLDKHYTWQTSLLLCVAQTTPNASLQNKQKESVRAKTKFTIPDHSTGHAGSFFPKEPGVQRVRKLSEAAHRTENSLKKG